MTFLGCSSRKHVSADAKETCLLLICYENEMHDIKLVLQRLLVQNSPACLVGNSKEGSRAPAAQLPSLPPPIPTQGRIDGGDSQRSGTVGSCFMNADHACDSPKIAMQVHLLVFGCAE